MQNKFSFKLIYYRKSDSCEMKIISEKPKIKAKPEKE